VNPPRFATNKWNRVTCRVKDIIFPQPPPSLNLAHIPIAAFMADMRVKRLCAEYTVRNTCNDRCHAERYLRSTQILRTRCGGGRTARSSKKHKKADNTNISAHAGKFAHFFRGFLRTFRISEDPKSKPSISSQCKNRKINVNSVLEHLQRSRQKGGAQRGNVIVAVEQVNTVE
jgi:hypothetical protein